MDDPTKLKLKGVTVIFANLSDEGFGKSITIDATDKEVQEQITTWVKTNNIGRGDNAGKPNFKEYEGRSQFSFKINDYTRFAGLNGLDEHKLGFGAKVSLIANAFEYDNKFGKGTSSSLSAAVIEKGANTAADADLAELLDDNPGKEEDAPITLDDLPPEYR